MGAALRDIVLRCTRGLLGDTLNSKRFILGFALVAAGIAAGLRIWYASRPDDDVAARERYLAIAADWAVDRTRGASASYAVVVAGTRSAMWAELLASSGVPLPRESAGQVDPSARLVVVDGDGHVDRLPERAVLRIVHGPTHTANQLIFGDVRVPLVGLAVTSLTPAAGETVLAVDDSGAPLITRGVSQGGGVEVRLGVDVAALLYRLRFGSPEAQGTDHDGNHELQPADLLPRVPTNAIARPFADELIARLLRAMDSHLPCSLPRTHGLPEGDEVLIVLTADQDFADDSWVVDMATALQELDAHATFMLTDPSVGLPADLNARDGQAPTISRETATTLLALGHDLGAHPFPRVLDDVARHLSAQRARIGIAPLAARNHHLLWFGFLDIPRVEARAGLAMNLDSMPVCDGSQACIGFPGGAGQPIFFVDETGTRVPIWHQPTSIDDFSLRQPRFELVPEAAEALVRASAPILDAARRNAVPVVVNAHPALYKFAPDWVPSLLRTQGARAITTSEWLEFVNARRSVRFSDARCGGPRPGLPAGVIWELSH